LKLVARNGFVLWDGAQMIFGLKLVFQLQRLPRR
jgi:hypothetical protein